jgi:hypothetical protein
MRLLQLERGVHIARLCMLRLKPAIALLTSMQLP